MIKYYRKSRRMNQVELANKANLSLHELRQIENNKTSPTLEQIIKLAYALEIDKYKLTNELIKNTYIFFDKV